MTSAKAKLTREQLLIEHIKEITGESLIGDDCAVLPGNKLVSSDMLVEGRHFLLPQTSYEDLGWKAMAVNLSDIAAMAGKPEFAVIDIAMPPTVSDEEFRRLYISLRDCAHEHGTRIVGGDLTGSDSLVISITVFGDCSEGYLLRSGAREGDAVVVTGDFGASALGLELLLRGEASLHSYACKRHFRPIPRLQEASLILQHAGSRGAALMDASDGLADALLQIAAASNVLIELDTGLLPIQESVCKSCEQLRLNAIELALYGGEDYELVACMPQEVWNLIKPNPAFTRIGTVAAGSGVTIMSAGLRSSLEAGKTYQHWGSDKH